MNKTTKDQKTQSQKLKKLSFDSRFVKFKNSYNDFWKNHDLIKKVIFTIFLLTIFVAAGTITIPGIHLVNQDKLNGGDFLGILNLVGGGGLRNFSVVALGISPFITASLIMMILQTKIFPPIYRLSQSGPQGRIKINIITRFATLIFAIIQAIVLTKALKNPKTGFGIRIISELDTNTYAYFILPLILIAGSLFALFLGELITNKGVGNGTSLIIFAGIASNLIPTFKNAFEFLVTSSKTESLVFKELINFSVYLISYSLVIFVVGYFYLAERHIPIQQVGAGLSKNEKELSYLPLKANPAGIMSVIFSLMVLSLPTMIAGLFNPATSSYYNWIYTNFQMTQPVGFFLFIVITFAFTLLMGLQQSKIDKISEDFAKSSTFIPGIRPGEQTEDYLITKILNLSYFSSIYLIIIGAMRYVEEMLHLPANIAFGGTGLMILVSVTIETLQQVQARYKTQELSRKRKKILHSLENGEEGDLLW
ncbi:preprotein translocase subunit SecY [Mycoplasma zalophi]|uniref:Protein translocase subunit SecY n=1 Tax=Mycoplasma zalophi TaxID=191287 RepID=A0ABS6DQU4_9MOLU|nr:preprotein translocase subunit SecY [Mycoplasma zalophi]MBU4691345.1 preprotein translocase subunit SecY [Mycoplasma zalophi]MBU4692571.1 preprotein translocase subunit SecY [Mycoplasma zalophi]MCU4117284.1 preprotein translocase subunit SecY [Mycoplasma zalophi]